MIEGGPFDKKQRIKPGAHARARRLRSLPTWTEAKLWERLRQLDIRIRRQAPIDPYTADFACLRARLVIEVDTPQDDVTQETPPRLLRPSRQPSANTPTPPSALEGAGS